MVIRDLGDGLVLRRATADDAEPLSAFVGDVLRPQDGDAPSASLAAWTRDLIEGRHPSFVPADATVVVDQGSGKIVSCLHLVSQTWTYGGTPIAVGQPELIGTSPDRRGGGLVRAQFEVVHGWSAARGQRMLAIAGIPWFYRQFGYELAIERGGGPRGSLQALEPLPPAPPGWRVRAAGDGDVAFLLQVGATASVRAQVTVPRDAALWRYELTGKGARSAARREILVLERDGEPMGYLAHPVEGWGGSLLVTGFEVRAGVSWREAWTAALPYLAEAARTLAKPSTSGVTDPGLSLWFLGPDHPLCRVTTWPERELGYAWYARVPDVAAFLRTVTPALERRLAASPCAGHTGTLTLGFYTDGVRLVLERGAVTRVEAWRPDVTVRGIEFGRPSTDPRRPLVMFPDRTFLQLLFGFRTLDELEATFPDCIVRTPEARALLAALFPKLPSDVWPVV